MDNAVERRKRHLSEGDEGSGQQDARRVRSLLEVAAHELELNPHRIAHPAPDGQQGPPAALAVAVVRPFNSTEETSSRIHRPPSPPESDCSSHNSEDDDSDQDDSSDDDEIACLGDATLAGYEYCSKEAIRYLMEVEKLGADHPVILQLQQHLDSRRVHVASNPGPSSNHPIP
uniref:Orange domain-containing protein n=1 Tax=Daphnia galeata TaxID=27404 RepID=A0A8J2WNB8_9CRUS|nr:unnamed protein product [Daphnia galeata]